MAVGTTRRWWSLTLTSHRSGASQNGLDGKTLAELALEPAVRAEIDKAMEEAKRPGSHVWSRSEVHDHPGGLAAGGDELTPTMKLRRKPIGDKYSAEIEQMYAG